MTAPDAMRLDDAATVRAYTKEAVEAFLTCSARRRAHLEGEIASAEERRQRAERRIAELSEIERRVGARVIVAHVRAHHRERDQSLTAEKLAEPAGRAPDVDEEWRRPGAGLDSDAARRRPAPAPLGVMPTPIPDRRWSSLKNREPNHPLDDGGGYIEMLREALNDDGSLEPASLNASPTRS